FGTVWLPYKTQCKTGRTDAKVRAMKSRHNFSQRTHPIVHVGTETHVLVCFVLFGCIWYRLVTLQNSVQNGLKWCKTSCHEVVSEFFTTNHSIHPIGLQPHVLLHFVLFGCIWTVWLPYKTQCKTGRTGAKVRATESRLKFS